MTQIKIGTITRIRELEESEKLEWGDFRYLVAFTYQVKRGLNKRQIKTLLFVTNHDGYDTGTEYRLDLRKRNSNKEDGSTTFVDFTAHPIHLKNVTITVLRHLSSEQGNLYVFASIEGVGRLENPADIAAYFNDESPDMPDGITSGRRRIVRMETGIASGGGDVSPYKIGASLIIPKLEFLPSHITLAKRFENDSALHTKDPRLPYQIPGSADNKRILDAATEVAAYSTLKPSDEENEGEGKPPRQGGPHRGPRGGVCPS